MRPPVSHVLDVTRLLSRVWRGYPATGIDRVGLAYVTRYAGEARALVRLGPYWAVLNGEDSATLLTALAGWRRPNIGWIFCALIRSLAASAATTSWLLNVMHSGTESPTYSHRAKARGLTPCYLLHDLIPLTHPEHCRDGEDRRHVERLRTMVCSGALLITNSRDTAAQLADYAGTQQWSLPPLLTAPLGVTALPTPTRRPHRRPYFLVLATIESRKNHALLLDVWMALIEQHPESATMLVVIGRRGWSASAVLDRLDHCPILKPHLQVVHDCDDVDLANWIAHAEALLYPSFVEGWGLPVAEALSFGVPVLASDLPVFREVAGAVPEYLSATDAGAWLAAVQDYASGSARRAAQLRRLQTWRAASWEEHFRLVDAALRGESKQDADGQCPLRMADAA